MPCDNPAEQIRITLDEHGCLTGYQLTKQVCGQDIGPRSLISDCLLGLSVEQLLAINAEQLCSLSHPENDAARFLHLKHLFAIQSALEAYTGRSDGSRNSPCMVAEIGYDQGQIIIDADISVELTTEKIRACPGCDELSSFEV